MGRTVLMTLLGLAALSADPDLTLKVVPQKPPADPMVVDPLTSYAGDKAMVRSAEGANCVRPPDQPKDACLRLLRVRP